MPEPALPPDGLALKNDLFAVETEAHKPWHRGRRPAYELPGLPDADLIYAGYALPYTQPAALTAD
ncbi:hypothetical protein GCM10023196_064130 [Actinoallomurus vinaceus]|uniref:Uncharacterized protein n=1 Tax=Actinoallomurus vinaceus TaxID=1080074 RepID=A0ABP8UH63_9ACTN